MARLKFEPGTMPLPEFCIPMTKISMDLCPGCVHLYVPGSFWTPFVVGSKIMGQRGGENILSFVQFILKSINRQRTPGQWWRKGSQTIFREFSIQWFIFGPFLAYSLFPEEQWPWEFWNSLFLHFEKSSHRKEVAPNMFTKFNNTGQIEVYQNKSTIIMKLKRLCLSLFKHANLRTTG